MAREIPEAVRAAAGLAATVLDEARRLPETLPGLPVRALGLAMQLSMKLQQHYAELVARGDELLTGLHGEDEPGLATFDDDEEQGAPSGPGTSAFDRVAETIIEVTDEEEPAEVLDELAIEELVDAAPSPDEVAEASGRDADGLVEAAVLDNAPAANAVDVLTPEGDVETVEATVTDEGVAAPEAPTTATDEGGTPVAAATGTAPVTDTTDTATSGTPAVGAAPVDGYDAFTIAQLRGRLRGYQAVTVRELVGYEEATRAREPYLRMLRNRLEKLEQQEIESSPLAPRGE